MIAGCAGGADGMANARYIHGITMRQAVMRPDHCGERPVCSPAGLARASVGSRCFMSSERIQLCV